MKVYLLLLYNHFDQYDLQIYLLHKMTLFQNYFFKFNLSYIKYIKFGDWGLGIGDWGLGIGPNPQSPIPNPHFIIFILI